MFQFTARGDLTIPSLSDLTKDPYHGVVFPVLSPDKEQIGRGYVSSYNHNMDWDGLPALSVELCLFFNKSMQVKTAEVLNKQSPSHYIRKANYGLDKNCNEITLDLTLEARSSDMFSSFDIPTLFAFKFLLLASSFVVWKYKDVVTQSA